PRFFLSGLSLRLQPVCRLAPQAIAEPLAKEAEVADAVGIDVFGVDGPDLDFRIGIQRAERHERTRGGERVVADRVQPGGRAEARITRVDPERTDEVARV